MLRYISWPPILQQQRPKPWYSYSHNHVSKTGSLAGRRHFPFSKQNISYLSQTFLFWSLASTRQCFSNILTSLIFSKSLFFNKRQRIFWHSTSILATFSLCMKIWSSFVIFMQKYRKLKGSQTVRFHCKQTLPGPNEKYLTKQTLTRKKLKCKKLYFIEKQQTHFHILSHLSKINGIQLKPTTEWFCFCVLCVGSR